MPAREARMKSERVGVPFAGASVSSVGRSALAMALVFSVSLLSWQSPSAAEEVAVDTCVDCHSTPTFLVTNRKLFDYFQKWTSSLHKQEGVTCVDCHGGDPTRADKQGAHGGELAGSEKGSAVNFRNVPNTCGECHEDIYDGFRKSVHFERVVAKKQEEQGPTCVTCHGSINGTVLNVTTVEEACSRCHNEESDNHPDTPGEARTLLNRFLSIHRYYRYITVRGDPVETKRFFEKIDRELHTLSMTWHTFDLDEIEKQTEAVLASLKEKREEVARVFKEERRERPRRPLE
jgi:nitrate/TMAO reductase-like tetraheme cytochrome c subunit